MQLLLSIFTDSFIIWARNFSLVYVVLLGCILVSFLMPKELGGGSELQLLLLIGSLLLMMAAFMAGWLNMLAAACRRHFARSPLAKTSPTDDLKENFSLLQFFLSGVSLHFIPVTVNFIVAGLVFFLLSLTLHPLMSKALPVFQEVLKNATPGHVPDMSSLPGPQRALLEQFSLALFQIVLIFSCFNLLVSLWPAYVAQYRDNIFKAYWHSILRFLKDPFRFLLITGLFIGSQMLLPFVYAAFSGNIFLGAIIQLGGLLFSIYLMVTLFVYAFKTSERPLCVEESDDEEAEDEPPQEEPPTDSDEPPST